MPSGRYVDEYEEEDIDIDGRDSNGNHVGGFGYGWYDDSPPRYEYPEIKPKFVFYSEQELVTSDVFQKQLGLALAYKDRYLKELQEEMMQLVCEWEDYRRNK